MKANLYSIDTNGSHLYEFSMIIKGNKSKPLTKAIIKTAINLTSVSDVKDHIKNRVYFNKPITDKSILKNKDVVCLYYSRL